MENKYWDKLSKLQPYSFWLVANGVSRVPDSAGNWLERHKVQELIEQADAEINELRSLNRLAAIDWCERTAVVLTAFDDPSAPETSGKL